jgi:hypothetical protein
MRRRKVWVQRIKKRGERVGGRVEGRRIDEWQTLLSATNLFELPSMNVPGETRRKVAKIDAPNHFILGGVFAWLTLFRVPLAICTLVISIVSY